VFYFESILQVFFKKETKLIIIIINIDIDTQLNRHRHHMLSDVGCCL
jgi:hypothetical protein